MTRLKGTDFRVQFIKNHNTRDSCGDGALEALLILATVFRLIARRSASVSAPLLQPHASGPASTHPDSQQIPGLT
ncbi:unnamed protein product [Boreogadus saida]